MRRGFRLKYLDKIGRFSSGNPRYYFRKDGKRTAMPDADPTSPEFIAAYARALGAAPHKQALTGTIAHGIDLYLSSDTYRRLAPSTRAQRRRIAEKIQAERGQATMDTLQPRHIRLDLAPLGPGATLNRWKVWRALGRFWVDAGILDSDPARDVRKPSLPQSDGYTAWTREDFEAFRQHWPIGTSQRLAFELAYQTCAAAVDLVALGPKNIKEGWISYTRRKSGVEAESPIHNAPAWFEASPHLAACLLAAPKHTVFLTTASGASRSEKAVSAWFSRACTTAGLPHLSLHGMRKGRATMFRENGATQDQRKAVLGHSTDAEAQHYSKSADLRKVIRGT